MPDTQTERPIIGVIASQYQRPGGRSLLAGIGESYLQAVTAAGGVPLLIHLTSDADVLDWHYRQCDALLFAGGGDIAPSYFHAEPHPQLGTIEPLRDEVELQLAQRAAADGLPMLGICRGIQLLNVALGGDLYQDIPSEVAESTDHYASKHDPEQAHLAHTLVLEPDSWLAMQLGTTELPVNSYHHQALHQPAPGLRVVGRSPDGIIEAVEGTGENFIVGIQCHPEEMWSAAEPRWARMFQAFVTAARQVTH